MSYGIIRVRNLHMSDLSKTYQHNERKYLEKKLDLPNVDPAKTELNISHPYTAKTSLVDAIKEKLDGVKIRKDSVVALEYVCTLSPEVMTELDKTVSITTVLDELKNFIINKHSEGNMIQASYHLDESNPHIHVVVVPLIEKEVKWKNRNGKGSKIEKRLCARDYTGTKNDLRQLQTDYYEYLTNPNFYLASKLKTLNIDIKRGIDARERMSQGKYYSRMTNYLISDKLKELEKLAEYVRDGEISQDKYQKESQEISNTIQCITDNIEKKKEKDSLNKDELASKYMERAKDFGLNF